MATIFLIAIPAQIIITISVVCAIFTSPVNWVVDFVFNDVLSAPTADSIKIRQQDTAMRRAGRRMSNAVRRASVNAAAAATAAVDAAAAFRSGKNKDLVMSTRLIPDSTLTAQSLAAASAANLASVFKSYQESFELNRQLNLQKGASAAVTHRADALGRVQFVDVDTLFEDLSREIISQRRQLRRSEQESFDAQWGSVSFILLSLLVLIFVCAFIF